MKVMLVIKTSGLIYDDRLIKGAQSLKSLGHEPEILVLETKNRAETGFTPDGIPYRSLSLLTRKLLPHMRGLALKSLEMCIQMMWFLLARPGRAIWFHDIETWGMIPLAILLRRIGYFRKIVWDHHELPNRRIMGSAFLKWFLRQTIAGCDAVVVANDLRKEYMLSELSGIPASHYHCICNYPESAYQEQAPGVLPERAKQWLKGRDYLLFQGLAAEDRKIFEVVEVVFRIEGVQLIVVGPITETIEQKLRKRWGNLLDEKVFITGYVPQKEMYHYVDHAQLSFIFYAHTSQNNYYCEPNRFYQAICRGIPVVVGNNPPLKRFIEQHPCGIVTESDGSDIDQIETAARKILANRETYAKEAATAAPHTVWEAQTPNFKKTLEQ